MALGGGSFITQNKVLPGAYINFVSAARASSTLSDRGIVALALELDWGPDEEIFTVTQEEFQNNSFKMFGYEYKHEKLKGLRDLFKNAKKAYLYKLNVGVKASNAYATAKYKGSRGNEIKIVIAANVDDPSKYDVSTYLGTSLVDMQIVSTAKELIGNTYVDFITTATLQVTAGTALTGGTNGDPVTGTEYQGFLDKIESYSFNALGCLSTTESIKNTFIAFTKRMRDEMGVKFQLVGHKCNSAEYEGVISVENVVLDNGAIGSELVYWTLGAEGACAVNKSCTNKKYDGEYIIDVNYKQGQLESAIKDGKLIFHKVGEEVRVLADINTFTTITDEKGEDFKSNQTIRVLDQIANDTAALFNNKYLGNIPNDKSGRISLWNDIVTINKELQKIRAIEEFNPDNIVVEQGNSKKSVVVGQGITSVNAMEQLYMTVVVQ
jgi:hypothetical protein